MARTKQTIRAPKHNAGSITVVNSSSQEVYLLLGAKVERRRSSNEYTEGSKEAKHRGITETVHLLVDDFHVDPGTHTIPLTTEENPKVVQGWTLGLPNRYGIIWRADTTPTPEWTVEDEEVDFEANWEIPITANQTYHFVSDPENMPLTEAQFQIIDNLLVELMQQPSPFSNIWSNVRNKLSSKEEFSLIPKDLDGAYDSFFRGQRSSRSSEWPPKYALVKQTAEPNKHWASQAILDKSLIPGGGRAIIDVYWRALDRTPGGNSDVHTICYTFNCENKTVSTRTATNMDGVLERSEYRPVNLSKSIQTEVETESVNIHTFPGLLNDLRALGPGDSECTILDTISRDHDEYNSEWSSHEILVRLPKPWSPEVASEFPKAFRASVREFLLSNQRSIRMPPGILHRVIEYAAPPLYAPSKDSIEGVFLVRNGVSTNLDLRGQTQKFRLQLRSKLL